MVAVKSPGRSKTPPSPQRPKTGQYFVAVLAFALFPLIFFLSSRRTGGVGNAAGGGDGVFAPDAVVATVGGGTRGADAEDAGHFMTLHGGGAGDEGKSNSAAGGGDGEFAPDAGVAPDTRGGGGTRNADEEDADHFMTPHGGGGAGEEGKINSAAGGGDGESNYNFSEGQVRFGDTTYAYYHCAVAPKRTPEQLALEKAERAETGFHVTEILLLHGPRFTKEDWKTSGILERLCTADETASALHQPISVTALDLSALPIWMDFSHAFGALVGEGPITGGPLTIITPSSSGKVMVDLGEKAVAIKNSGGLAGMVKAWIPLACFAVLQTSDEALQTFADANIPILAFNADEDARGKESTQRLKDVAGAEGAEIAGKNRFYLDHPDEFVEEVLSFLKKHKL